MDKLYGGKQGKFFLSIIEESIPFRLQDHGGKFHCQFSDLLQVAYFDTAIHHDPLRVAWLLPIPCRNEDQGMRRLGLTGCHMRF